MGYSVMIRPDVDFQKQAVHNLGMTAEDLTERVRSVVRKVAPNPVESIERDDLIGSDGLGFDSIARVELLFQLDEDLGVTLEVEVISDPHLTFGQLVDSVTAAVPQ
jgi:acyl carrier protein